MDIQRGAQKRDPLSKTLLATALFCGAGAASAAVNVRVQPNGNTVASAYLLAGESRTYFGNVSGGSGNYQCSWSFSDGTPATAFVAPADRHYITNVHTFANAGNHFATLACREAANPADSDSANIEVTALAADNLTRQKNSAIDRGLRYAYRQQNTTSGCFSGSGGEVSATGMALLGFENHGHNLESPDEDIYKEVVTTGLQCLFDRSATVDLTNQSCIGDPEDNDGDGEHDGQGVAWDRYEQYHGPFAVLAIVNSSSQAFGSTYVAHTTTGSNLVDGHTLRDIIVDAKDYLAFSQTDSGPQGGGTYRYASCRTLNGGDFNGYTSDGPNWTFSGYEDFGGARDCYADGAGTFNLNYGDTTSADVAGNCSYGSASSVLGDGGEGGGGAMHSFATPGIYNVAISLDGGALCELSVEVPNTASTCGVNAWRYNENDSSIDNSVSQWPILALFEAKKRWGINVNSAVITEAEGWLAASQNTNGGFGYDASSSWVNFAKTGAGIIMHNWAGNPVTDAPVQSALAYLDLTYDNPVGTGDQNFNFSHIYGMYAFYKGMKLYGLPQLDGRNWETDYTTYFVGAQTGSDFWYDNAFGGNSGWMDVQFATYKVLAMLAPEVASLPPVANAGGPYPNVNPDQDVLLDGSNSFHQDDDKAISRYDWDFDTADGLWWETKPVPNALEGATGMQAPFAGYPDVGSDHTYTVTLRVTDNGGTPANPDPVATDTDTAQIRVTSGNVAPVAVTNGPWAGIPGTPVVFDGSASHDPNVGAPLNDMIVAYEWDLDGDGLFNEANGNDGTPVVPGNFARVTKTFPAPVSGLATLRVTDRFGLQDSSSAQFLSIAVVFAQNYEACWSTRLNRNVSRRGLTVQFSNIGTAPAENMTVKLTSVPTNLTVISGVSVLGQLNPGQAKTTACNATAKTADIVLDLDTRVVPTGNWAWSAEFDWNGAHYIVPNLPPLGP